MPPPSYIFDRDRLAALSRYAILDTPAEPGFDDIVQLAAQICEAPVALVSLVAADRQWFKARVGFDACETDLNSSVCAHALVEPDLLVIPDLTLDNRTSANPLVTSAPHIRFYAGAPFHAATGEVLGSLCVIDSTIRPHGLTHTQASGLKNLARQVTSQLELRRAILERDALVAKQLAADIHRNALLHLGDSLRDTATAAEMTSLVSAVVGQTLNASRVAVGRLDDGVRHVIVEADWTAPGIPSLVGRHRLDIYERLWSDLFRGETIIISDVTHDPRTAANPGILVNLGVQSLVYVPVREHGKVVAVFVVHHAQPQAWSADVVAFLGNVADRLEVGFGRLKAEAEQEILNHELSHRLKNTFAMIQAIARQTLKSVPDRAPVEAFMQRLGGLSAAHDVLLKQKWTAAKFDEVVTATLTNLVDASRFDISGPALEIGSYAALSTSLLLHELTTNALKYGALSGDEGQIKIAWHLAVLNDEVELTLKWQERGGPSVQEPARKGFGSRLISMGLVGTGGVDLRYLASGLEAEFRAPFARMQLS